MKLLGREIGRDQPLFLIAGPCVIESRETVARVAGTLAELKERLNLTLIFKASYDKANRTSGEAFRGPGIDEGLEILAGVREDFGLPVLTDVHTPDEVERAAKVVDVVQTPAFLCRQTDLIEAVARCGRPANVKKGQFLSPQEMIRVAEKAKRAGGEDRIMLCERGTTFGYNNLVVDMRSLDILGRSGCPVVFDATHAVQLPGGSGSRSGGEREFVPVLARAAVASGIAGIFMETHPEPESALSDGPNAVPLHELEALMRTLLAIDGVVKANHNTD